MTYEDGALSVTKASLDLKVLDAFINLGDPIPNFSYVSEGLVCLDSDPSNVTFTVYDSNNNPVSGTLSEGTYTVRIDPGSVTGLDFYNINFLPGTLSVNPEVGCNDRINLYDICKTENPDGSVTVTFFWENTTPFDIFIPFSDNNYIK